MLRVLAVVASIFIFVAVAKDRRDDQGAQRQGSHRGVAGEHKRGISEEGGMKASGPSQGKDGESR